MLLRIIFGASSEVKAERNKQNWSQPALCAAWWCAMAAFQLYISHNLIYQH
jgi:hypothetical protein